MNRDKIILNITYYHKTIKIANIIDPCKRYKNK